MPHEVFISHCSGDKELAEKLIATLESHGVRCWAAMRDALFGPTYAKQIVDAIRNARMMVLLFSTGANDSPHILREVEKAVDLRVPIVTVRIQKINPNDDLDYFLKVCHWMDAYTGSFEAHALKLAAQIRDMVSQPAASASAPAEPAPPKVKLASQMPAVPVAPAPAVVSAPTAEADTQLPDAPRQSPVVKFAAVALLALAGIGAAGWFFWPQTTQASWHGGEHYLSADEVRTQIAGELGQPMSVSPGAAAFKLANIAVTRQQFASFVKDRNYTTAAEDHGRPYTWKDPGFHQEESDRVVCVDWNDAVAFCNWLGPDFRLPSEAEWAYAAGHGNGQAMTGKVWQWTADNFSGGGKDAAAAGDNALKAVRGGTVQPDLRFGLPADGAVNNVSFRVGRDG